MTVDKHLQWHPNSRPGSPRWFFHPELTMQISWRWWRRIQGIPHARNTCIPHPVYSVESSLSNLLFLFNLEKPGPSPHGGIFDGPCLSRIGGVRVTRLCLRVWCFKSQIPSTKLQINLKFQISNRFKAIVFLFGILNFGHCYLVVFWDLLFGIPISQWTFNKANPLWG